MPSTVTATALTCSTCGAEIPDGDEWTDPDGDIHCEDCAESVQNNTCTCEDCDEEIWVYNSCDRAHRTLCESCANDYQTCDSCEWEAHEDHDGWRHVDNRTLCDTCFSDEYTCCEDCHEDIPRDDANLDDDGNSYCDHCWENHHASCRYIHDYNYRPAPCLRGKGPLYLGMEIEIECGEEETAGEIAEYLDSGRIYCKHDGSLDTGVEIVWHPADLAWWKSYQWPLQHVIAKGGRSHNTTTCGLHIHADKRAWSPLQIYRTLEFFRRNTDWIVAFSRRKSDQLQKWAPIEGRATAIKYIAKSKGGTNRYTAINLTNRHTVEFRIFRGSLNTATVLASLEFVHALWHWTATASTVDLSAYEFKHFVSQRTSKSQYRNLSLYIAKRGI